MTLPDQLRALRIPETWRSWGVLSGSELEIPKAWTAALMRFLNLQGDASFHPLEVKDEGEGKRVLLEVQAFHPLADKDLGLLDGMQVQLSLRIELHFNGQGVLTDAGKEPPSDRDLKAAARHVLNLLAQGNVELPGSLDSFRKSSGPPKPWRVVQDDDGRFRLERAYFA